MRREEMGGKSRDNKLKEDVLGVSDARKLHLPLTIVDVCVCLFAGLGQRQREKA